MKASDVFAALFVTFSPLAGALDRWEFVALFLWIAASILILDRVNERPGHSSSGSDEYNEK